MPSSDAILSDIGHGTLGVRYRLRPFRDLLGETIGQRHLWVEFRPKKLLATWTSEGSGVYSKAVSETFDGIVLDVVGVQTITETLARVESVARVATVGTFYYSGSTLYIHLTAGANPSGTSVVAQLGYHVGSHGVYQPVFCSERMTNGGFEAWTGTTPDGWTKSLGGTCTIDKTTSDPLAGSYAARATFTAGSGFGILHQDFTTLLSGAIYRFSGAYRASAGQTLKVVVWDTSTLSMAPDGQTIIATDFILEDSDGVGEWRRFIFDFIAPSWATVRMHLEVYSPTSDAGTLDLDEIRLACISRFAYHEPLLDQGSLPTIESGRPDSFWGPMSSSLGALSLLNAKRLLEPLLATYDWLGADAVIRVGGRFTNGSNEVPFEDCPIMARGRLGRPIVADSGVAFELEDDRVLLQRTLPTRTYNNVVTGGLDAYTQPDKGRGRALLWGTKLGVRPVQYDIHYTGGGSIPLGRYEMVDCTDWSTGIGQVQNVHWYADEDAAKARSSVRRESTDQYSFTNHDAVAITHATGRFDVLLDLKPIEATAETYGLWFDLGGTRWRGAMIGIPLGYFQALLESYGGGTAMSCLCYELAQAMNNAAGGPSPPITVTFSTATQKVSIGRTSGTLNLRCATGDGTQNAQNGLWSILGFDATVDKTGASSYTADTSFTRQAFDQVIRVDAIGFKDDASGTYTGTPSVAIEKAPDIAHFILRVILGVPASQINVASFVAARSVAMRPCSLYIQEPRSVADVFEELETSGDMDVVQRAGLWECITRDTSVPADTPDLVDADFLSFEAGYDVADIYGTVTLTYNESPDGGDPVQFGKHHIGYQPHSRTEMGEVTDATVALRFGRGDKRFFRTCLKNATDATYPISGTRLEEIAAQCSAKRRRFRFATKGKALLAPVGGKLRLTRTSGLDTTGVLSNVLVRVLAKRDDWARWISDVEAIEVV